MSRKAGLIFAPCNINIPATPDSNAESDKCRDVLMSREAGLIFAPSNINVATISGSKTRHDQ